MSTTYKNIKFESFFCEHPLPCDIFVLISGSYIVYRPVDDIIDRDTYNRIQARKISHFHIQEADIPKFEEWSKKIYIAAIAAAKAAQAQAQATEVPKDLISLWKDTHRKTLDIFQSPHPDHAVAAVMDTSRKLVAEVMKLPQAVKAFEQIQTFSRGTVDHSLNVAILSVYLAIQMGYTHAVILQNLALGGLLHDIGKKKIDLIETESPEVTEAKKREHPLFGAKILESIPDIPNEVSLIVAQHHEFYDGSGFPKKMRGIQIYDLARIVAIANTFDRLVSTGKGSLQERQKAAVAELDKKYFNQFDPDKHGKAVKILKLGI